MPRILCCAALVLSLEAVRRASAIITASLLVVGGATWLILMTHPVTYPEESLLIG